MFTLILRPNERGGRSDFFKGWKTKQNCKVSLTSMCLDGAQLCFHCIIHEVSLLLKLRNDYLENLTQTLVLVVNFIVSGTLNYQKFWQLIAGYSTGWPDDAQWGVMVYPQKSASMPPHQDLHITGQGSYRWPFWLTSGKAEHGTYNFMEEKTSR